MHRAEHCVFLFLKEDFLEWLALPLRCLCSRGIAYGNDDDGFLGLGHPEQLVATVGVEVAYPAGAKPLLGGCKAEMLHGDGDIDVAMRLAVGTHPFLFVQHGSKDVERRFVEPRTCITRLKLFPTLLAANDAELPGLLIHGRRSQLHTFLDVCHFLLLYRFAEICTATIAPIYDIKKRFAHFFATL